MHKYIGTKLIEAEEAVRYFMPNGHMVTVADSEEISEETHLKLAECAAAERGYKVRYPDGYMSWSPKNVFEEAYRPCTAMNFGLAIEAMRLGQKVARRGWNGTGIHIELQCPDEYSKMTHPYIFIDTTGLQTNNPDAPKDRVPWLASQTDMLAEDWYTVEELDVEDAVPYGEEDCT